MRIYTRTGDRGETGILGGGRLAKSDPRIRALGSLDELGASLGMVLTASHLPAPVTAAVRRVQGALFEAGASLASPAAAAASYEPFLREETVWLESEIDRMEETLPPLRSFILPGGGIPGATLHWARTVARRAETQVVDAALTLGEADVRASLLRWLNRLSDALFVMARAVNLQDGEAETPWHPSADRHAGGAGRSRRKAGKEGGAGKQE